MIAPDALPFLEETFTFTHPQTGTIADDLTAGYRWSKDLQTFNADGATDGDGTKVDFTTQLDTPSAGITTVRTQDTPIPLPQPLSPLSFPELANTCNPGKLYV
jgi:hypothetical protein